MWSTAMAGNGRQRVTRKPSSNRSDGAAPSGDTKIISKNNLMKDTSETVQNIVVAVITAAILAAMVASPRFLPHRTQMPPRVVVMDAITIMK